VTVTSLDVPSSAKPMAGGASAPIVEVRNISQIYPGGVEALNNISLTFPEGELTSLL